MTVKLESNLYVGPVNVFSNFWYRTKDYREQELSMLSINQHSRLVHPWKSYKFFLPLMNKLLKKKWPNTPIDILISSNSTAVHRGTQAEFCWTCFIRILKISKIYSSLILAPPHSHPDLAPLPSPHSHHLDVWCREQPLAPCVLWVHH